MNEDIVEDTLNDAFKTRKSVPSAVKSAIVKAHKAGNVRAVKRLLKMTTPEYARRYRRLKVLVRNRGPMRLRTS